MHTSVLIALGSNQSSTYGCARDTVRQAIADAAASSGGQIAASPLYRTPAFPPGSGPDFVNAALGAAWDAPPADILAALHRIEAQAGRTRAVRWAPRTLDLDLIAVGDAVLPDPQQHAFWRGLAPEEQAQQVPDQLILPHPRLQDRAFVLVPLADVAPDWVHPVLGLSVRQMCDALPEDARKEVVLLDE